MTEVDDDLASPLQIWKSKQKEVVKHTTGTGYAGRRTCPLLGEHMNAPW